MRKLTVILVAALMLAVSLPGAKAQQLDSTRLAPLDSMLTGYFDSMLMESVQTKVNECDFLIGSCRDTLVRRWVATRILQHYMSDPPLMGEEAVALYVYDKWFGEGGLTIEDEWIAFEASMFAEFNRQSQLYMTAPELTMLSPSGDAVGIPSARSYNVIYFFDTSCSKCKALSTLLQYSFESFTDLPITLYAIYTGVDEEEWAAFRKDFVCTAPHVKVEHVWDPEVESDYQKKYAVVSTPKLYLVDTQGTIIGRRLEAESLRQLLSICQGAR